MDGIHLNRSIIAECLPCHICFEKLYILVVPYTRSHTVPEIKKIYNINNTKQWARKLKHDILQTNYKNLYTVEPV